MLPAIQTSLSGLMRSSDQAAKAASNVVRATVPPPEPTPSSTPPSAPIPSVEQSMVDLTIASHGYKANAKALRIADETLGKFLDEMR